MMKLKTERTEMDMMSDSKSKGIKLAPLSKYFVGQTSTVNFQNVYGEYPKVCVNLQTDVR